MSATQTRSTCLRQCQRLTPNVTTPAFLVKQNMGEKPRTACVRFVRLARSCRWTHGAFKFFPEKEGVKLAFSVEPPSYPQQHNVELYELE